jgi:hypothetical protein
MTDDIDKPTRNESRVGAVPTIIADDIEQQIFKILDKHHCVVTEKLGRECSQSLHQLIEQEKRKANVEGFRLGAETTQKVIWDKIAEVDKELKDK